MHRICAWLLVRFGGPAVRYALCDELDQLPPITFKDFWRALVERRNRVKKYVERSLDRIARNPLLLLIFTISVWTVGIGFPMLVHQARMAGLWP